MTSIQNTEITIHVDRQAGTIRVEDPTGTEYGTIEIFADGQGWTRTNLDGQPLATYNPNRDHLLAEAIEMLTDGTQRPTRVVEA